VALKLNFTTPACTRVPRNVRLSRQHSVTFRFLRLTSILTFLHTDKFLVDK